MADLILGAVGMIAISLALFFAGRRLTACPVRHLPLAVAVATVIALILFAATLWDNVILTRFVPTSNVIILGNWQLPLAAMLCGLASGLIHGQWWRRWALLVPLVVVSLWRSTSPLLASPPSVGDEWNADVCMQTTDFTCSPAAAATLLRAYGIPATEQEMAELCLTTEKGTSMLGLYRGLKIKTLGTPWRVQEFSGDVNDLRHAVEQSGPVMLTVGLDSDRNVDPRYANDWGWTPGVKHTVVLFDIEPDGHATIADPNVGRETWNTENLRVLSQGQGLRLVPRTGHITYAQLIMTSPYAASASAE